MIGVLIVTHGKLAEGFVDSASMIMGDQEQLECIGLFPDSDLESFATTVKDGMLKVDSGDGILVFVDMFGASPCNFAAANIAELIEEDRRVRIVTGLNLAMLIESLSMRTFIDELDELYSKTLVTGKDGIKELLDTLSSQEDDE